MSLSVFNQVVAQLQATTDPARRSRLEWFFAKSVAGLPGLSVDEALAAALARVILDDVPVAHAPAQMHEVVTALAPARSPDSWACVARNCRAICGRSAWSPRSMTTTSTPAWA